MRIELVDEQRALQLAREAHPAGQFLVPDQLSGRVAGIGDEQRGEAAALHLAAQVLDREGVAALAFQQDGDGGERAKDVQQLLVRRVVGQEMAQVDVAQRGRGAGQRSAPAAADGDVLGRVLGLHRMRLLACKINYDLVEQQVPFAHTTESPAFMQTKCARL